MDGVNNFLILVVGVIVCFLLAIVVKGLIDLHGTGGFVKTKSRREMMRQFRESGNAKVGTSSEIDPRQQWRAPANGEIDVPIDLYVAYKKLESRLEFLEQMAFEKNLNANKKG